MSKKGERTYTAKEVCEKLDIHKSTLNRLHSTGKIDEVEWAMRPQPHRRYRQKDIDRIASAVNQSPKRRLPAGVKIIAIEEENL